MSRTRKPKVTVVSQTRHIFSNLGFKSTILSLPFFVICFSLELKRDNNGKRGTTNGQNNNNSVCPKNNCDYI